MIFIIGNNLTSKCLFLNLIKSNVEVMLCAKDYTDSENTQHKIKYSTRTMAISIENLKILRNIIDIKSLINKSGCIQKIIILNTETSLTPDITFNASDVSEECMAYIVNYTSLQNVVDEEMKKYQKFIIHKYDIDNGNIVIENETYVSPRIINTESKNWNLQYQYNENGMVFNIKHTISHKNTAIECFTKNGPIAILPLKDINTSNVVLTLPKILSIQIKNNQNSNELIEDIFLKKLERYIGLSKIDSNINTFPLFLGLNNRYDNKILNFGSALFNMHPIAGQGFNVILRDIERIKNDIIKNRQFNIQRHIDIKSMLFITHNLNQFFKVNNLLISKFRKFGMFIINNNKYIKNYIIKNAIGNGLMNKT